MAKKQKPKTIEEMMAQDAAFKEKLTADQQKRLKAVYKAKAGYESSTVNVDRIIDYVMFGGGTIDEVESQFAWVDENFRDMYTDDDEDEGGDE